MLDVLRVLDQTEIALVTEEILPANETVQVPTARFTDVEASHAGASRLGASRIERTLRFAVHDGRKEVLQRSLEQGLEAPEHEIASRSRIDEDPQVLRDQILGQSCWLDASMDCRQTDDPMGVRVNELQDLSSYRGDFRVERARNPALGQDAPPGFLVSQRFP